MIFINIIPGNTSKALWTILHLLIFFSGKAQQIAYQPLKDTTALHWKNLTIIKMDSVNARDPYGRFVGEAGLKHKVNSLQSLTMADLRRIRRKTGKKQAYEVTIDVDHLDQGFSGSIYMWYLKK